ncbi:hypothetical protein F4778DRAFT_799768 [Xylariomycetidae sp. FL2044]|nr:hypothetical protein F4778DRAFT_799768 [Xylariomycetidae sp. FL2044]
MADAEDEVDNAEEKAKDAVADKPVEAKRTPRKPKAAVVTAVKTQAPVDTPGSTPNNPRRSTNQDAEEDDGEDIEEEDGGEEDDGEEDGEDDGERAKLRRGFVARLEASAEAENGGESRAIETVTTDSPLKRAAVKNALKRTATELAAGEGADSVADANYEASEPSPAKKRGSRKGLERLPPRPQRRRPPLVPAKEKIDKKTDLDADKKPPRLELNSCGCHFPRRLGLDGLSYHNNALLDQGHLAGYLPSRQDFVGRKSPGLQYQPVPFARAWAGGTQW